MPMPARRESVADEIVAAGGVAIGDTNDVSTEVGRVGDRRHRACGEFGRIDIVVNNAGIVRWGDLPDVELDALQDTLDVHLVGSFNVTRAAWPHLVEQEYGRVVMTTSTGMFGLRGNLAYAAAKAGVVGLMRNMKLSGRRYGITVNAVAPVAATRMGGAEEDDGRAAGRHGARARRAARRLPVPRGLSGERRDLRGRRGRFSRIFVATTEGYVRADGDPTPEDVAANWATINDEAGYSVPADLPDWAAEYMKHLRLTAALTARCGNASIVRRVRSALSGMARWRGRFGLYRSV